VDTKPPGIKSLDAQHVRSPDDRAPDSAGGPLLPVDLLASPEPAAAPQGGALGRRLLHLRARAHGVHA
jgi:hypothetical protein